MHYYIIQTISASMLLFYENKGYT